MKNPKVLNFKLWLLAFSFAFLAFTVLGYNESLQAAMDHSDTSSVDNLVAEAAQIIRAALDDDEPQIRANAIEVVADTKRAELMPKVQRLLKDDFVPVRFLAALAVGDTEYRLAKDTVKQLLQDRDDNVRIAAAYAMGKLGEPDNFRIIQKTILSKNQTVRANCALLLGKSGDKSALKPLYWALKSNDSSDKVRFNAVGAIAKLGDERIYSKLWAMLISAYANDRVIGIRAMGALGTVEAKNALITMLDDDVLEVRLAAAEQLGMLGDNIGEFEVLNVFKKNLIAGMDKAGAEHVKMCTALAIGRIGTAPLMKFLPDLLKDESKIVRIAASKAVFQCQTAK